MGLIERGGQLKYVQINQATDTIAMQNVITTHVDKDAVLITDSHTSYVGLNKSYAGHEVVNHSHDEYVRAKVFHTNSIEGAFSLLKRSLLGIYHQVTPKHLLRYCDESAYRYNTRKIKDAERFTLSLRNVEGRLTYKNLVNKPESTTTNNEAVEGIKGAQRPIAQIQDGVIVNQFESINEAAKATGMRKILIWRVLKGQRRTSHGFEWKYL